MQPEIIVALITAVGGIIVSAIAAYSSAKKAHREDLKELKAAIDVQSETVSQNKLKVDTLWDIYVEDAIRVAQREKLVASSSFVRPTENISSIMPEKLQEQVIQEVLQINQYMSSPYNIAIEIWSLHKKELIACADTSDISVRAVWGGLVTLVHTTLLDNNKISIEDIPVTMAGID